MNDDQVLANVMLSEYRIELNLSRDTDRHPSRYYFPHFSPEEKLEKRQVFAHQDDYGQAYSTLLLGLVGGEVNEITRNSNYVGLEGVVMHNMKPRTLGPTVLKRRELIGS